LRARAPLSSIACPGRLPPLVARIPGCREPHRPRL